MQQLREAWEQLKFRLKTTLALIEESPAFERLVYRYEGLDPRSQRSVRNFSILAFAIFTWGSLAYPILSTWSASREIAGIRSLTDKAVEARLQLKQEVLPPEVPSGWQSLSASSLDELETSLGNYLTSINLSSDLATITKPAGDTLAIAVSELNIRQAQLLFHQIDGWFPTVRTIQQSLEALPGSRENLKLTITLRFDPNRPFRGMNPTSEFGSGRVSQPDEDGTGDLPTIPGMGAQPPPNSPAFSGPAPLAPPDGVPLLDQPFDSSDIPPPPPPGDGLNFEDDDL